MLQNMPSHHWDKFFGPSLMHESTFSFLLLLWLQYQQLETSSLSHCIGGSNVFCEAGTATCTC